MSMVELKSGREFRETGLLWLTNTILHNFGWAITWDKDTDELKAARVKFRGFDEHTTEHGYQKVARYLKNNIEEIEKETRE